MADHTDSPRTRENRVELIIDIAITDAPARDRLVVRQMRGIVNIVGEGGVRKGDKLQENRPQGYHSPVDIRGELVLGTGVGIIGAHEWCGGAIKLIRASAVSWVMVCDGGCNLRIPLHSFPTTYANLRDVVLRHIPQDL